jgi:hypothetical protein
MSAHTLTFGAYSEKYQSNNIFMNCCTQSAYAYNSLADFYSDANSFLTNPQPRRVAGDTLRRIPDLLQQRAERATPVRRPWT